MWSKFYIMKDYQQIINFFDKRSTNAASESFNAKIKNFRSQFRGVKDKVMLKFIIPHVFTLIHYNSLCVVQLLCNIDKRKT